MNGMKTTDRQGSVWEWRTRKDTGPLPSALKLVIALVLTFGASAHTIGPASATNAAENGAAGGIVHGVHLRPTYHYGQELAAFNSLVAKKAGIIMYFTPWAEFDSFLVDRLREELPATDMPVIVLTWEPLPSSTGCNLAYGGVGPLRAIAQGNCDSYIRGFARAIGARQERFILRFAHEMNIADMPWWPGHYGSDPGQYVAAYRRIRGLFQSEAVTNVEWAWSPNYASHPYDSTTYAWNDVINYYPGDAYVDWVGLSGYNWGDPWRTFAEVYDEVLRDFTCRYAKPQLLLEVGSVEGPGGLQTKANWMIDMYESLPQYPFVRGVVWFNDYASATRGQADFRITTSTADFGSVQPLSSWTSTYRTLVSNETYVDTLPSVSEVTPPGTVCVLADQLQVEPRLVLIEPGEAAHFTVSGVALVDELSVAVQGIGLQSLELTPSSLTLMPPWDTGGITVQSYPSTQLGTYDFLVMANGLSVPFSVRVVRDVTSVFLPIVLLGSRSP